MRPWSPADVPAVAVACRDPEIVRWTTQIPEEYTEDDARAWIESTADGWPNGAAELAITDAESGEVVGAIGLVVREAGVARIGYWVAAPFRGRGLATRALRLMSDWADGLGFARLQLTVLEGNTASERVAAKAGFVEEGRHRAREDQRGVLRDVSVWARTRSFGFTRSINGASSVR